MISHFIWFDLYDQGNRGDLGYAEFEFLPKYYIDHLNSTYILSSSGYCGALFLGVL